MIIIKNGKPVSNPTSLQVPVSKTIYQILKKYEPIYPIEVCYFQSELRPGENSPHGRSTACDITFYPFFWNPICYALLAGQLPAHRIFLSTYNRHIHVDTEGSLKGYEALYRNRNLAIPITPKNFFPRSFRYNPSTDKIQIPSSVIHGNIIAHFYDPNYTLLRNNSKPPIRDNLIDLYYLSLHTTQEKHRKWLSDKKIKTEWYEKFKSSVTLNDGPEDDGLNQFVEYALSAIPLLTMGLIRC